MTVSSIQRGNAEQLNGKKITGSLLKPLKRSELLSCILSSLGFSSSDPARTVAASSATVKVSRQLRVLVAEDNRVNQMVAVRMLETMGHLPVVANNGREALEMMESETFDLICMDVQMPHMDGLTATRKIREKESPTGSHIPIIAMTAHAVKGDREKCFEAGMDGYVSKPVTIRAIADAIAEFFPLQDRVEMALPSPPTFASGWSRSKLVQMLNGDESLARELVGIFLEESPKQLESLRRAVETVDQQEVERISHSLKSELGYLGLKDAAEKAKELERISREGNLQSAAQLFASLETHMLAALATMQTTFEDGALGSAQQVKN
jgi:CheY-like chemotaxis protein/HPt (histidine-containing phosphotransfer) domain-containing protein